MENGGGCFVCQNRKRDASTRDRTKDLQIFSLTLSQLSYRSVEGSSANTFTHRTLTSHKTLYKFIQDRAATNTPHNTRKYPVNSQPISTSLSRPSTTHPNTHKQHCRFQSIRPHSKTSPARHFAATNQLQHLLAFVFVVTFR